MLIKLFLGAVDDAIGASVQISRGQGGVGLPGIVSSHNSKEIDSLLSAVVVVDDVVEDDGITVVVAVAPAATEVVVMIVVGALTVVG